MYSNWAQEIKTNMEVTPRNTGGDLRFNLLGPLRAWHRDQEVNLGSPQQRAVLFSLLLAEGNPVTVHHLVDGVWGDTPPTGAVSTVRTYVSRLRSALEPERSAGTPPRIVLSVAGGYALRIPGDAPLDMVQFEKRVAEAKRLTAAGNLNNAADLLAKALDAWQGLPVAGVPGPLAEAERSRLVERRVNVLETRLELDVRLGRHDDVVAELATLCKSYPLRERLRALLMLSLYRCGRQAEALDVYRHTHETLVEELGIEPGPELQELHRRLLCADPALAAPPAPATIGTLHRPLPPVLPAHETPPNPDADTKPGATQTLLTMAAAPISTGPSDETPDEHTPSARPAERPSTHGQPTAGTGTAPDAYIRPRQLPADLASFTGRTAEIDHARALVPAPHEPSNVIVISGMAGVGKSVLAIRIAHTVATDFPDGQLYANLRGFDPTDVPVAPASALRSFLLTLGMPLSQIPQDLDAQAALYRSVLAQRRLLIVLDNARDSSHIRPLLPGTPGCMVIVTSRDQLTSIVAAHGARPISLDVLQEAEAVDLLTRRLGAVRTSREPDAVQAIVSSCDGLPLALSIVATRAALHPAFTLANLSAELREAGRDLDSFVTSESGLDARSVFSWSYLALRPTASRLFRLLSHHPGPRISLGAATSLAGLSARDTQMALEELARAHLVVEVAPRVYTLHKLLRAYAGELAAELDSADERDKAVRRLLDYLVCSAESAVACLVPEYPRIIVEPAQGSTWMTFDDKAKAMAWLEAEGTVCLAAVRLAAHGHEPHCWRLACLIVEFPQAQEKYEELLEILHIGVDAAVRNSDRPGIARSCDSLGQSYIDLNHYDDAQRHLYKALPHYEQLADWSGQARVHRRLSLLWAHQGENLKALRHAKQALDLYRGIQAHTPEAETDGKVGRLYALVGEYEEALRHCREAAALFKAQGDEAGLAAAYDTLSHVNLQLNMLQERSASPAGSQKTTADAPAK
ncbi:transcriptional regulator [Streptomyces sp. WAC 01325]|uniref:AfsR/SARP family transcriptional regulator n=1 Tax=Streptomyces sp. WAC 01325 TaxID=2203202 RepID=UPI000F89765A|nr:BTAD domain-containing putative transcriptional regulator [Streptomyces sp. WAC 01325]RSN01267.1 transcriptional regulator [Streptomyces sp. WAC 01325]